MTRYVLRGNSMKPFFWPGDVLVVEPIAAEAVALGQVVVFPSAKNSAKLVAHRVIKKISRPPGEPAVLAKGDNVSTPDPEAGGRSIVGRVTGRVRFGRIHRVRRIHEVAGLVFQRADAWMARAHPRASVLARRLGGQLVRKMMYRRKPNLVWRIEGDEGFLFDPATGALKLLNETGAAVWNMLEDGVDRDSIVDGLVAEYEGAGRDTVAADVDRFIEETWKSALIEEVLPEGHGAEP
jgi:signal peptidase I